MAEFVLPPGLGTIYFRKETGKWVAQLPPSRGRRTESFFDRNDAVMWLIEQYAAGKQVEPEEEGAPRGGALFRDVIADWSKNRIISESTRAGEKQLISYVRKHRLGSKPMGKLRPDHVKQLMSDLPVNTRRIKFGRKLSVFFGWAVDNGYTTVDLYARSGAKKIVQMAMQRRGEWKRDSTDVVWSAEQIATFIAAEKDPQYQLTWALLAVSAGRCEDVLGLEWGLQYLDEKFPWGLFQKGITTSDTDPIVVPVPKGGERRKVFWGLALGAHLQCVQVEQAEFRASCSRWEENADWILDRRVKSRRTMFGRWGMHLAPGTVQHRIPRHAARLGLERAGSHVFRRSLATLASDLGYNRSMIIDVLGHKPGVTDGYIKTSDSARHDFAEHMTKLLLPPGFLKEGS